MATANTVQIAPTPLHNGAKLIGEAVLPGASLLMDGDFGRGALHTVGAVVACAVLGPVGALAFAANSFANSVTGKGLVGHASSAVTKLVPTRQAEGTAAPAAPAAPTK